MQEVIAGLEWLAFPFEKDVEKQKGTGLLPFQGMDSECGRNPEPRPPPAPTAPSFLPVAHQGGVGGLGPTVLSGTPSVAPCFSGTACTPLHPLQEARKQDRLLGKWRP